MDTIIGLILGIPTALGMSYVIALIFVRLTAEPERPDLFPYGDLVELPEESRRGQQRLAGGGQGKADPFVRNDVRTHRDGSPTA